MVAAAALKSRQLWQGLAACADAELPLLEGALLIARDEYPELPVADCMASLERIAVAVRRRLRAVTGAPDQVRIFNEILFDRWGFRGDGENYYDPRNSYLNEVLHRRRGIPISLSVIYLECARRAGVEAHGVSFPGHFLVRVGSREAGLIVDSFAAGACVRAAELTERLTRHAGVQTGPSDLDRYLRAASNRSILVRMLRNLKAIYIAGKDAERALRSSDRILTLLPAHAAEYRDRALLYQQLEVPHAALNDFRRYLELSPQAPDSAAVGERIDELQARVRRLH